MAEKKAAGKNAAVEAAPPSGDRRRKLILIGAGAVGMLLLGAVLGWLLLAGNDAEETPTKEPVPVLPAHYVALGQRFTVTLPGSGKPHYLQVAISALTHDPAVVEELEFNAPLVRDRLNSLLARQSFDALRTEEGRTALRAEVLAAVRGIVAEALAGKPAPEDEEDDEEKESAGKKKGANTPAAGVEDVFFTEFVVQ